MTQEEKQLLLKDLCARLPYGVKVCARFNTGNHYTADITAICADRDYIQIRQNVLHSYTGSSVEDIRPYLRPMSSMTEEEEKEFIKFRWTTHDGEPRMYEWCDYANAHHFDYRGLIEKGLALEAPEDMYHAVDLNVVDTVDDIMYDIDSDNVEVIYKSGKKTIHNIESLKLISSDERELGTEHDYLIEPNIHVVFYPEGHISTFYFDE